MNQLECIYTEPDWEEILIRQEELLAYSSFSREQALDLGLRIERIARTKFHGAVAIRIIEEDTDIFSYRMAGSVRDADWWMQNKYIAARFVRMSSLRALVTLKSGRLDPSEQAWNEYVCGGCIPVFNQAGGRPFAYVVISGMKHYEDHEIIAEAMAEQLGVEIPHITRSSGH